MGEQIDRLTLALAGTSRVKSYFRKSKTGKTVHVDAHTRSVDKMNFQELQDEFKRLQNATAPADVNRRVAVVSRLRTSFDHKPGEAFNSEKSTAAGVAERKRVSAENNARIERDRIAAGRPSQAERLAAIKKSAAENNARIDREREAARGRSIADIDPDATGWSPTAEQRRAMSPSDRGRQIDRDYAAWTSLDDGTKKSVERSLDRDRSNFDMGDEDTAWSVAEDEALLKRLRAGTLRGSDFGKLLGIVAAMEG